MSILDGWIFLPREWNLAGRTGFRIKAPATTVIAPELGTASIYVRLSWFEVRFSAMRVRLFSLRCDFWQ